MAGRGPLPKREEERRRRNAPTIPTTDLPVSGFAGPYPAVPKTIALGKKGKAWWDWAWRTSQAAAWSAGDVPFVARRATLEDDLHAIESTTLEHPPGDDAGVTEWRRYARDLEITVGILAKIARASLAVQKEMRELEDRLGLNPKALAFLRWKIVADAVVDAEGTEDEVAARRAKREEREARLAAKS